MKTWLVLDCNFLCHRAFHAMGGLESDGVATAVVFGFLSDLVRFTEEYKPTNVVFCFDVGKNKRRKILSTYKESRQKDWANMPDDEYEARYSFYEQVKALRTEYIPELGYRNIVAHRGYEADDCIAQVCNYVHLDECFGNQHETIIISSDHDLYQLLRPTCWIYNPASKKRMTFDFFQKKFGIHPDKWAMVKAIAGCNSDDVPGVRSVGEVTALKYLTGRLAATTSTYGAIEAAADQTERNLELVRLPLPGCPEFRPVPDSLDPRAWRKLARRLGMATLAGLCPIPPVGVRQRGD